MGRRQTIDRDAVLDAAEAVVGRAGAAALTLDAVAAEAGITKGGVQYCFGSKDALIDALFARWEQDYERDVAGRAGPDPVVSARIRAHVDALRESDVRSHARAASLMALLVQTPEHLLRSRDWYAEHFAAAEGATRLAFLASEGLFLLRYFGLMSLDEAEWAAALDEIATLLPPG